MSDKKKRCLKVTVAIAILAFLITGLCFLCNWLFNERVKEETFQNVITEFTEEEKTAILDTVLIGKDTADLLAAYIPIGDGCKETIKEYAFQVTDKDEFAKYLEKFAISEDAEKAEDISFGDSVLACRNVYVFTDSSFLMLYEYGQNYWLIKQGSYIKDSDKETVEGISFKYAFKKTYGFDKLI